MTRADDLLLQIRVPKLERENAAMRAVLRELEGFLDDQADADDGIPNDAMRHLIEVRTILAKAEGRTP